MVDVGRRTEREGEKRFNVPGLCEKANTHLVMIHGKKIRQLCSIEWEVKVGSEEEERGSQTIIVKQTERPVRCDDLA